MSSRRSRARQTELAFLTWGGARPGAGRKPTETRARVVHRARPAHDARHPIHVTVRLRKGLPTLRQSPVRRTVERALAFGNRRAGFRLVHFSLQSNHIHLLAEAGDRRALSRGMQALLVRVSRALNRHWKRRGPVFWDRFHARPLATPREVRTALVYVLQNARHHGVELAGPDPYSSGRWFDGWKQRLDVAVGNPGVPPRTWLLRTGWRKHGCIGIEESPARARGRDEALSRQHGIPVSRVRPASIRRTRSLESKRRE